MGKVISKIQALFTAACVAGLNGLLENGSVDTDEKIVTFATDSGLTTPEEW